MEIGNINLTGGKTGFRGEVITLTSVISITVNGVKYHIETTTQEERGMKRVRVNAQIFFLCKNVY